jgi:hypothetical protein
MRIKYLEFKFNEFPQEFRNIIAFKCYEYNQKVDFLSKYKEYALKTKFIEKIKWINENFFKLGADSFFHHCFYDCSESPNLTKENFLYYSSSGFGVDGKYYIVNAFPSIHNSYLTNKKLIRMNFSSASDSGTPYVYSNIAWKNKKHLDNYCKFMKKFFNCTINEEKTEIIFKYPYYLTK